jgi:hypothetical protein
MIRRIIMLSKVYPSVPLDLTCSLRYADKVSRQAFRYAVHLRCSFASATRTGDQRIRRGKAVRSGKKQPTENSLIDFKLIQLYSIEFEYNDWSNCPVE